MSPAALIVRIITTQPTGRVGEALLKAAQAKS